MKLVPVQGRSDAVIQWLEGRIRGRAQQPSPPLTLNQAVQRAVESYPAVRVSAERVSASSANIQLARTSYLPQSVVPSISGPVLGTNSMTSVWGSAVGVLVSWEPFDFGLRRSNVEAAQSAAERARADQQLTQLQVGAAAADAFLTVLAAEQKVAAARAGTDRAETVSRIVDGLAATGLRPGTCLQRRAIRHVCSWGALQVSDRISSGDGACDFSVAGDGRFIRLVIFLYGITPGPSRSRRSASRDHRLRHAALRRVGKQYEGAIASGHSQKGRST